jgi:hypothetical protein
MNFKDFLVQCDITKISCLKSAPRYYKERAGQWIVPSRHPALRYQKKTVTDIEIDYLVNIFDSDDEETMTAEATSTTVQPEVLQRKQSEPGPSPKMQKRDADVSPVRDAPLSGNTAILCEKSGLLYWEMNVE